MSNEFNPYREWLGLAGDAAPDYYALLALPRFEADERNIATAAEQAATKVRSFRPGANARAWSQLLDQIRAAKECLCDPAQKADYDANLRAGRASTASASSVVASSLPPSALGLAADDLFPPGMARPASQSALPARASNTDAFPPSAKAANPAAQATAPNPAADSSSEVEFTEVLDDSLTAMTRPEDFLPPGVADDDANSLALASSLPMAIPIAAHTPGDIPLARPLGSPQSPYKPTTPAAQPASPLSLTTAPTAASFATNRRRQRTWILVASAVAGVALIAAAGITGIVLLKRPRQAAGGLAVVQPSAIAPSLAPATVSPPSHVTPSLPAPQASRPLPEPTFTPPPTMPAVVPPPIVPSPIVPSPAPPTVAPEPTTPAPAPTPVPATPPPSLPVVTRGEVQALVKALEAAKEALSEQNFKVADAQLAKAEAFAKLPQHRASVARLKRVAEFVKQFREAIAAAVQGMQAGETFKVGGSTQVSFVEGLPDKVILRIAGTNKTYAFNDLPPGLALVIADFKLPASDPKSRAAKGAYLLLHKRATSDTHAKAVALWQEAQAAGENMADLLPFLNENYADLLKDLPAGSGQAN